MEENPTAFMHDLIQGMHPDRLLYVSEAPKQKEHRVAPTKNITRWI